MNLKGLTKERIVKTRVNQNFFRKIILANYNYRCAISGVDISSVLIASHIKPWQVDKDNRLNPENGICLDAFYDKCFDITLNAETKTFDCFECAIHAMAPSCVHCQCRIIGHGVEDNNKIYCCAHCAKQSGSTDLKDRSP